MNIYFVSAALLIALLGLAHSVLGEWLLLGPLFRLRQLPRLIGSHRFARRTLRLAWHLTTVLLWGSSVILVAAAGPGAGSELLWVARILSLVFLVCALVAGIGSRGRHFSWFVFLLCTVLVWLGSG